MAVTFLEDARSRSFTTTHRGTILTTNWVCFGSDNELEIYNAARADLPTIADGLIRTQIGPADFRGGGLCFLTITYGNGEQTGQGNTEVPAGEVPDDMVVPPGGQLGPDDNMPATLSFTTAGGTAHITQSIKTVHEVGEVGGPAAPKTKQAIGLRRDGVDGCDIIAPKMEFSWQIKRRIVTFTDMKLYMSMTAKTNNKAWKGFEVSELLYLGAEGQSGDRGSWIVTHKFAYNPNLKTNDNPNNNPLVLSRDDNGNPLLKLPQKLGWDYVWTMYKDEIKATELYPKPFAAYVEQVYEQADFGKLGLGN